MYMFSYKSKNPLRSPFPSNYCRRMRIYQVVFLSVYILVLNHTPSLPYLRCFILVNHLDLFPYVLNKCDKNVDRTFKINKVLFFTLFVCSGLRLERYPPIPIPVLF